MPTFDVKLLIHHRKKIKMSQKELAQKLNVSQRAVSYIESGRTIPSPERMSQIMEILGVDENAFFGPPLADEKEVSDLIEQYALSQRDFDLVCRMLQTLYQKESIKKLSMDDALELLRLLRKRGDIAHRIVKTREKLDAFDRKYVYVQRGLSSPMHLEVVLDDDGNEVTVSARESMAPPDWDAINKVEAEWVSLELLNNFLSQVFTRLISSAPDNLRHFALDFLDGKDEEDLQDQYGIKDPTEKMIELLQRALYIFADRTMLDRLLHPEKTQAV